MQRRFALATALAFTIVVTIGVLALGSSAGWFGHDGKAPPPSAVAAGQPAQAAPQPQQPAGQLDAAPEPIVRTEYVYVDQPGGGGGAPAGAQSPAGAQPAAFAAPPQAPTAASAVPSPRPTSPAAPTATAPPAPTATQPAPTQPPPSGGGQSLPNEIEFTGVVTAINGKVVTFSHGGTSTDVTVNSGAGSLSVGESAHVHAILSGGVYVAVEIETGG